MWDSVIAEFLGGALVTVIITPILTCSHFFYKVFRRLDKLDLRLEHIEKRIAKLECK